MGTIDETFRKYLHNNRVFADVVNQMLTVTGTLMRINADELQRIDSSLIISFAKERRNKDQKKHKKNKSHKWPMMLERNRDAVRLCTFRDYDGISCVLGIEVQAVFDRSMPLRVMGYEYCSLSYALDDMLEKRRLETGATGSVVNEMHPEDYLPSAYTCVLVIEGEAADWPANLQDITRLPVSEWKWQISNVPLHVITLADLAKRPLAEFCSDMGIVARLIVNADDENAVMKLLAEDDVVKRITPEGINVIYACTNWSLNLTDNKENSCMTYKEKFEAMLQRHVEKGRGEGRVEGRVEGREEGREEGRVEGREECMQNIILFDKNCGIAEEEIVKKLIAIFSVTNEQAWTKVHKVADIQK